jgi:hypothetical protein
MKIFSTFLRAITAGAALGIAAPAAAGSRRICAGPPIEWMGIQPGARIGRFHLGPSGIENLKDQTTKPFATGSDQSGTYQAWKWQQDFTFSVHEVRDTARGAGASAFEFEKEPTPQSPCIALMVHWPRQSRVITLEQVNELLKKGSAR